MAACYLPHCRSSIKAPRLVRTRGPVDSGGCFSNSKGSPSSPSSTPARRRGAPATALHEAVPDGVRLRAFTRRTAVLRRRRQCRACSVYACGRSSPSVPWTLNRFNGASLYLPQCCSASGLPGLDVKHCAPSLLGLPEEFLPRSSEIRGLGAGRPRPLRSLDALPGPHRLPRRARLGRDYSPADRLPRRAVDVDRHRPMGARDDIV